MRNAHKSLVGIPEGSRPLQRPGYKLEDEVKSLLQETGYGSMVCGGTVLLKPAVLPQAITVMSRKTDTSGWYFLGNSVPRIGSLNPCDFT